MSSFADPIYIPAANAGASSAASHIGRMRLGEIFIIRDNVFELVCFHCSRVFHDFGDFTSHTHEHLVGIGSTLAEPDKMPKRKRQPEKSMKEEKEIDPNDIFAGLDLDADNGDDSDVVSAYEPEEFGNDDDDENDEDDATNHMDSDKSHSGIDDDIAERLAKECFELDESPEAEEYSRYIYDYRFRNVKGWFKCPKCCHKSKKHSHIKRHIFTHLRRKIFKCTLCAVKLSNLLHVRQHQRFHQEEKLRRKKHPKNDSVESFECPEIGENDQFREVKATLKANSIAVEGTLEATEYLRYLCGRKTIPKHDNQFLCPKCSYSSFHPNHVKRHFATHFKKRMFTCLKCLKKIGNIEDCRKHMNFVHGMQMDRINFASLDAEAKDEGSAAPSQETHKKSTQDDNTGKGVQCELCGKTIDKLHIEEHMTAHRVPVDE